MIMNKFPYYENQVLPDSLNLNRHLFNSEDELLNKLKIAHQRNQTIYAYCNSVDDEKGIADIEFMENSKIKGYIEKDEVTYKHDDDGEVHVGRVIDCLDNNIGVKILGFEEKDDKILVRCSRKKVVREIYERYNNDIKNNVFTAEKMVKGIITGMDYNKAYIDIGGDVTAILGVADISRSFVKDPSEILEIGQEVELVVKKLYSDPIKVSLSRAMLLPGWESIDDRFEVGKIVPGTIKNQLVTGLFVELDESFEGIADFPTNGKKYSYGDRVKVKINVIDKKREKIKLKIIGNR